MRFYWSWKQLPELRGWTRGEFRRARWRAGLRPFRHWQVWLGLLGSAALLVSGLEAVWGAYADGAPRLSGVQDGAGWRPVMYLAAALLVCLLSLLPYRHAWLSVLRRYVADKPPAGGSGAGALLKSCALSLFSFALVVAAAGGMDRAINALDESPDPRIAALARWPEPVPENENGFIAAVGAMAPAGQSPFEAGKAYIARVNSAGYGEVDPSLPENAPPEGLAYAAYDVPPAEGAQQGPSARFCDPEKEFCWDSMCGAHADVAAWLDANKTLLARYLDLQKYPRWQDTFIKGGPPHFVPQYQPLLAGQGLLQASAMLAIEKGRAGEGVALIVNDIRFIRRMLEGKNDILGTQAAALLLHRDLEWLAQTLHARPAAISPYWDKLMEAVAPLSPAQLSLADAIRFQEQGELARYGAADSVDRVLRARLGDELGRMGGEKAYWPRYLDGWARHHFKRNATANLEVEYQERLARLFEIRDAALTPPFREEDEAALWAGMPPLTWRYNQAGKYVFSHDRPNYYDYANRLLDLNAMNSLVRLQLMLTQKGVPAEVMPEHLEYLDRNETAWRNPLTGKPFEWDNEHNLLYFTPVSRWYREHAAPADADGRVGVRINDSHGE